MLFPFNDREVRTKVQSNRQMKQVEQTNTSIPIHFLLHFGAENEQLCFHVIRETISMRSADSLFLSIVQDTATAPILNQHIGIRLVATFFPSRDSARSKDCLLIHGERELVYQRRSTVTRLPSTWSSEELVVVMMFH